MTAACHSFRELIGGYVLDALEPDEREQVRRHLETCEPCAREHAELATLPVLLDAVDDADAAPLRPPARLEEAVLDRFARERRGAPAASSAPERERADSAPAPRRARHGQRRLRWLAPAFAVAACAIVAAVAVVAFNGDNGGSDGGTAQARVYRVALSGAGPTPAAVGDARLYPGDTGTGVHLEVSGLKPETYDYELWCVRDDGWKISAGTFRVDANGHAEVKMTTAAKPTEYDSLSIQAQPQGRVGDAHTVRVLSGRIKS